MAQTNALIAEGQNELRDWLRKHRDNLRQHITVNWGGQIDHERATAFLDEAKWFATPFFLQQRCPACGVDIESERAVRSKTAALIRRWDTGLAILSDSEIEFRSGQTAARAYFDTIPPEDIGRLFAPCFKDGLPAQWFDGKQKYTPPQRLAFAMLPHMAGQVEQANDFWRWICRGIANTNELSRPFLEGFADKTAEITDDATKRCSGKQMAV